MERPRGCHSEVTRLLAATQCNHHKAHWSPLTQIASRLSKPANGLPFIWVESQAETSQLSALLCPSVSLRWMIPRRLAACHPPKCHLYLLDFLQLPFAREGDRGSGRQAGPPQPHPKHLPPIPHGESACQQINSCLYELQQQQREGPWCGGGWMDGDEGWGWRGSNRYLSSSPSFARLIQSKDMTPGW